MAVATILVAAIPLPQLDADSYLYANIASQVARGEWVVFRHQGWLIDKPPLQFWLMGGSFAAFGVSNATIRAWHVAMALLLIAATVLLGRAAGLPDDDAWLGGAVLATSTQFLYQAIVPQDDVPMTAFITLAVASALRWRRSGGWGAALLCGGAVAVAVLAKGLAACAVFALAIAAMAWVWRRPYAGPMPGPAQAARMPRAIQVLAALMIFVGLAAPWFLVGVVREGPEFVHTFFAGGTLGVGRYFRPAITTLPPYPVALVAFVPLLFAGFMPWSPALLAGCLWWRRACAARGGAEDGGTAEGDARARAGRMGPPPGVRAVALWAAAIFVALSLSRSDRIFRYLLPCLPPAAVVTAWLLRRSEVDRGLARLAAWVALAPGVLAFGSGAWWLWTQFPHSRGLLVRVIAPVMAALALGLVAFGIAGLRHRVRLAVVAAALAVLLGWVTFERGLRANARAIDPWPTIAGIRSRAGSLGGGGHGRGGDGDIVLIGAATEGRHALTLFLGVEPTSVDAAERAAAHWRQRPLMVVAPADRAAEVEALLRPAPARVYRELGRVVVFVNASTSP